MNNTSLETRRTMFKTGSACGESDNVSKQVSKLYQVVFSRPFTQQLELVFPSCASNLNNAVRGLQISYRTSTSSLVAFIEYARPLVNTTYLNSNILALGKPGHDTIDTWSLDTRGVLTLAVGKDTYERLGMVGQRLVWKGCEDIHIIEIWLHPTVAFPDDAATRKWNRLASKHIDTIDAWDKQRGPWQVVYCMKNGGTDSPLLVGSIEHQVTPTFQNLSSVKIPQCALQVFPDEEGEQEVWDEEVSSLFEWVGMIGLGSQRLQANDKTDPYVAVYEPPIPSRIGDVTHVKWTGLLPPEFVQNVVDSVLSIAPESPSMASVTGHSVPTAPAAYLKPSSLRLPLRAPRPESEDTWSLLLQGTSTERKESIWVLAESIGKWDTRWG